MQQSKRVDRRGSAKLLHKGPFVHQIEEILHVLIVDGFGVNTKDKRVGDTFTLPLGMQHVILWHGQIVM